MKKTITTLFLIFIAFVGIASGEPKTDTASILKVAVYFDGKIELNGKTATIGDFETELKRLKERNGVVWYYRESGKNEPSDEMMAVFMKLIEAKIPMSLSSKPNFSDYIDENGHSKPRIKLP